MAFSVDRAEHDTSAPNFLSFRDFGERSEHSVLGVRSRLRTDRVFSDHVHTDGYPRFIVRS
jgi:hypothetical protein